MHKASTPLAGKSVVIACSESKSEALASGLGALGAEVRIFTILSIRETQDKSALDAALDHLHEYAWIVFTSTQGVRFFLRRMEERGIPKRLDRDLQICAVGSATAAALETAGICVSLVPREYVAEGILNSFKEKYGTLNALAGLRILLPRAREARDLIPRTLEAAGVRVDVSPCYENVLPEIDSKQLQALFACTPDLLVFTSSSTVKNFIALIGSQRGKQILAQATVAALGPVTESTLAAFGKQAEIRPSKSTIAVLLEAIRSYYESQPERD
ncbi:MAG: uroporphyrinogen-III synthase [Acidobacteriota bacterium]|jgi:uroporphyrinogen III methyltransferase/synthase